MSVPSLVLGAILLVACVLRFHGLENAPPGLCHDEAMNGVNLMEAIESGSWQVFYPDNGGREGLFINIQGAFVKLQMLMSNDPWFAVEPWMLRFPSAVFGSLTVAGLYFLAVALTRSRVVGAASAFLLATSFWHVNFSRIGFRAISAPFWLVWGLFLLVSGFQDLREHNQRRGMWKLVAAGLCYGAGFHSYIAYRVTPVLILAALVWLALPLWRTGQRRAVFMGLAVFAGAALLAVAPLALYFLQHPREFIGRSAEVSILKTANPLSAILDNSWKTVLMFNYRGDGFWRHNIAGRPQLFLPVGLLFLAGLAISLKRAFQRRDGDRIFAGLFAILWLLAGALPAVLSSEGIPHALRGLLMAPACFLLAGLAAEAGWNWLTSRYSLQMAGSCAAVLALALTWECYASYFGTFVQSSNLRVPFETEMSELAREIRALPNSAPKYIIAPGDRLDRRGVPESSYPLALETGSYSAKGREDRRIRFIVGKEEAERAAAEKGAYVYIRQ